ncbi:FAD-dependent oxidoreductase [Pseudonocardia phyllosphaerae]|uniref:FAD-dependent oxidoreductase n=1 Tax=Pseudonocardia phyllosphaerae TaxID=3390502 RepID=UPI00397C243C
MTASTTGPVAAGVPGDAGGRSAVVLGGGIAGLVSAYRLAQAGRAVTLLESAPQLGGLGTFFDHDGHALERFYHCVMPSDTFLLPLLGELGLADGVRWEPTTMGMVADGHRYPFNTALDLLRFDALTLPQRIRFGAVSVSLRRLGRGRDLDRVRTEDWLRRLYGDTIWESMFVPMFGGKFGDAFGDVPANYLWQRLGRESNVATRGYPEGGYASIVDALHAGITARGGTVRTATPVAGVDADDREVRVRCADGTEVVADDAVSTLPLPALAALASPALAPQVPAPQLRYQGVVNAVFFLDRPLDGHYWAPVMRSGTEFDGVVEMSALTGTERYGGKYVVYAMHYCGRDEPLQSEPEADIARRWSEQLVALYPDRITAADVAGVRVFRAPFVEPIYPLGYGSTKPGSRVGDTRLRLATTAQVYPDVTSWNSSTGLAEQVVSEILAEARTR